MTLGVTTGSLWIFPAAAAAAALLALALTALALRVAPWLGYVDRPGAHKSHQRVTPYGGGVAIFLTVGVASLAALAAAFALPPEQLARLFGSSVEPYLGGLRDELRPTLALAAGGVALFLLGIVDDIRALGPYAKLAVMLGAALLAATAGETRLAWIAGPSASLLLTVLWITTITNAFNFLDNMDGLSAGVALICGAFLVACGAMAGQVLVPLAGSVFCGAVLGFLVFNFPPARIFMGDAGSLLLGYTLSVLAIRTSYYDSGSGLPPFTLAMPLAVLAVPLYDFASVVVIRLCEGRNPLRGDQRHFSHRLVQRGLDKRSAVLTIYLATATTGLAATLLPGAGPREALTVVAVVGLVLAIVAILEAPLRKSE